ncbi:MAG: PEP-CTERM sorting domain-containing protein [Planctomycetota bacterium]
MKPRHAATLTTTALIAAGLVATAAPEAHAATLIDADFNSDAVGTYGLETGDISGPLGGLAVTSDTPNGSIVAVVDDAGDRAVQYTDNNTSFVSPGAPHLSAALPGLSTTSTGDSLLSISYNYTYFDTTGTGNPLFQLLVNTDGNQSASAADRVVQLQVNGNSGSVLYWSTANPPIDTGVDLVDGREYLFEIDIDLSSDLQDTYDLTVTDTTDSSVVIDVDDIATRLPNDTPDVISFSGGANGGVAVGEAFAELDNILVTSSPIPEPASLILITAGGLCLAGRRRRPTPPTRPAHSA